MAGMQFEYDEKGGTFYYFLLSFVALILIPATYYLWPRDDDKGKSKHKQKHECYCDPCRLKSNLLKEREPWRKLKRRSIKFALFLGWIFVAFLAYKTSQVELDFTEFDPFKELGIDREASTSEIKRAYRQLTLIHHPDKGGDERKFLRISKAYKALTDEEARKNWEEHGNPDGPGATHFGIALPKWIVEKQNSMWVLAVYALVFMVLLPVVVGTWWYRTIQYSAEQILMDTTQLYYYLFHKTPNMHLKRVIMILGASFEFESGHNQEIISRRSDNEEIPMLMRDLPNLNEKNKERPLCCPYSVKARALVHAHLTKLPLPPDTLEQDKRYILKKCPYLINEMVSIVAQLVALKHAGRVSMEPRLDTLEHCMKLSQMIVQGVWDSKSPLLQLPHIEEDSLRHFVSKRRNIHNIQQFVSMKDEDRRNLLRNMSDREYQDVVNVCAMMPHVTMEVRSEVLDDEDKTITAGSIVTVTVSLRRENLLVKFNQEDFVDNEERDDDLMPEEEEEKEKIEEQKEAQKPKAWEKNKKKKGKGPAKKKKPANKFNKKTATPVTSTNNRVEEEEEKSTPEPNGRVPKARSKRVKDDNESTDERSTDVSDLDDSDAEGAGDAGVEEEDDWVKFQEEAKKENALETKSKETHLVHCPFFPATKYEWWWLYIADRKTRSLITAPVQVTSLRLEEEVQLKVSAPHKPGTYQYTVILRSDSYIDFDLFRPIKLEVKAARKIESHPQWEISDEEEEAPGDDVSESELSTDDDSDY